MPVPPSRAIAAYYRLRQALGVLGLALPVLLVGGMIYAGEPLPPALSDFVYTDLAGLFTGVMFAIGVFLVTYVGYGNDEGWLTDRRVSSLAGIGAMGTALFPNDTLDPCSPVSPVDQVSATGILHVASAGVFLVSTCVFCLVLFRRTAANPSAAKRMRNRLYLACGLVILVALAGLGLYFLGLDREMRCDLRPLRPVLWLEVATVWAFGLAWLVKGRGVRVLNDPEVGSA